MEITLKYGHGRQTLRLPDGSGAVTVLEPDRTVAHPEAALLEAALAAASEILGPAPSIVVMPEGGSFLPHLAAQAG
jgi:hypothetical protein